MKTIILSVLGLLALTFRPAELTAQTALVDSIINLVERYEKYASFTEDGLSFNESYEQPFKNLFVRGNELGKIGYNMQVYNDINEFDKQKYYRLSTYFSNLKEVFPQGVNISMNITELGKVRSIGKYYKSIDIKVIKSIYGLRSMDEKIIKKDEKLIFKIKFREVAGKYTNFKIITIESQKLPLPAEGLHMGLYVQPGLSTIASEGIIVQYEKYSGYSYESAIGFGFGGEVVYYLERFPILAFGTRVVFRVFNTSQELVEIRQNSLMRTDVDEDIYSLEVSATNLNEEINLSFIEIPIFVKGKYDITASRYINHVYANLGPVFSISASENILTSGEYELKGYYPDYHVQLYNIPFYGYQKYSKDDLQTNSTLKQFSVSAFAELGINIPIARDLISIDFAMGYQKGLISIASRDVNYLAADIGQTNTIIDSRESVYADFLGVSFSIIYRLF